MVIFENELWELILREVHADVSGRYRIRMSAYGYQAANRPVVVARVMTSDFIHNRFGAAFDLLPDKPRMLDFTMWLREGEMFWLAASGCNFSPDGKHVGDMGGETFGGTGMAIQWIEAEGPLLESWPPPSMHRVFGDLPIVSIEKPKRREIAYEVISENDAEEADKLVTTFASRAFRRPVTGDQISRYLQLAHNALAQGVTLEGALRRAYKAILVSPEFLFLQENPKQLDDFALASRLSYFLWSTMPDDELLCLAGEGKLHDPATLRARPNDSSPAPGLKPSRGIFAASGSISAPLPPPRPIGIFIRNSTACFSRRWFRRPNRSSTKCFAAIWASPR